MEEIRSMECLDYSRDDCRNGIHNGNGNPAGMGIRL